MSSHPFESDVSTDQRDHSLIYHVPQCSSNDMCLNALVMSVPCEHFSLFDLNAELFGLFDLHAMKMLLVLYSV
jgi:hypothetical protein